MLVSEGAFENTFVSADVLVSESAFEDTFVRADVFGMEC